MRKYEVKFLMVCTDSGEMCDIDPWSLLDQDNEDGVEMGSYSIEQIEAKMVAGSFEDSEVEK